MFIFLSNKLEQIIVIIEVNVKRARSKVRISCYDSFDEFIAKVTFIYSYIALC